MNTINTAISLLRHGETAVVLNTDGELLEFKDGVPVRSGNWKISRRRIEDSRVSKVIIYQRDPDRTHQRNEVYVADYAGVEPADANTRYGPGRYVVKMKSTRHVGSTRLNWREFAETFQNPVRFLTKGQ